MTTSNPFAARLAAAAQEGYIGSGQRRFYGTAPTARPAARTESAIEDRASERQLAFVKDLLIHRDFSAEVRPAWRERMKNILLEPGVAEAMTRAQASAFIDYALTMPQIARTPEVAEQAEVPAGRYAVEIDGTLRFYSVDRPETGRWAGGTFVERQVSDDFMRISKGEQAIALNAIREAGFAEASKAYGRELGVCGVCARTLTNEASRAAGIGPVCAGKSGW